MFRKHLLPRTRPARLRSALRLSSAPSANTPARRIQGNFPLPPDYQEKTEYVFARLMYPTGDTFGGFRGGRSWQEGYSIWTQDYPRADRHFATAVRRLSRIHVRSVEQPVNLDDGDDVFNYPWLYAVQVGQWRLTDPQAAKLREYLLRGGFFAVDDFWGQDQWENFMYSMRRVSPDRPVVDIPNNRRCVPHLAYDCSVATRCPVRATCKTGVNEKKATTARPKGAASMTTTAA